MTGPSIPLGLPTGEPASSVPAQSVTLRVGLGGAAASGSLFDRIGGAPTFDRLVRRFYEGVQQDEVIWPMYPADDLEGAVWRLSQFLQQYWGGPSTYSQERGHPRLRMRHAPFTVNTEAAEHWLTHFRAGLDEVALTPEQDAKFWGYVTYAAQFMLNSEV